jgi:hypothetical protein
MAVMPALSKARALVFSMTEMLHIRISLVLITGSLLILSASATAENFHSWYEASPKNV